MKPKSFAALVVICLFASLPSFGQKKEHFYNVDKEIRIEGKIQQIAMEPRYKNDSPFLIITLEEKDSKKVYTVEMSPAGFFDQDFYRGEHLSVTGSITSVGETETNLIAREVQCRGETFTLRDRHGFPTWRGTKGMTIRKGKRKGNRI